MKKILIIIGAIVVLAAVVGLTVVRAQSGYTKVLIGTVAKENLVSIVSATGQIRPKTYVNVGANAMGRVTHFYVNEGDRVKKGQIVATIENVQQEANVAAQQATIAAAQHRHQFLHRRREDRPGQRRSRQGRPRAEKARL